MAELFWFHVKLLCEVHKMMQMFEFDKISFDYLFLQSEFDNVVELYLSVTKLFILRHFVC